MPLVKDKMSRKVVYVEENDSLESAHSAMVALSVHHVPVLREGAVVGMLSDRDVLRHSRHRGHQLRPADVKVGDVMSKPVIAAKATSTIRHAAELMLTHSIHCLPVVDLRGVLVGILTSADLIRILCERGDERLDEPLPFVYELPSPLAPMFS